MLRKPYGYPYTQRHIRRMVSQRRSSLLRNVNSQLLEYIDLSGQKSENTPAEHHEYNGNKDIIAKDDYSNTLNFQTYLSIYSNNNNYTSTNHGQLSTIQSQESNISSEKSLRMPNNISHDDDEMEQLGFLESAKNGIKDCNRVTPTKNIDQLMLLLEDNNEENSDNESDAKSVENQSPLENEKDVNFLNAIRNWSLKYVHTVPHIAINDLLSVLHKFTDSTFPNDARTLLKTPRVTKLYEMSSGQYCHYGLKRAISIFVLNFIERNIDVDCIELLINIDGAPLATSSEKGLWIISCSETILNDVEVIGIYHGEEKPSNSNDLLKMFVEELILLIKNGFICNGKVYKIKLHALICDAPAKAYILNIKYHTGYSSCTKCEKEGEWLNKVCFPGEIAKLRTDEDFKKYKYMDEEYQRRPTILTDIPNFGLVTNVVLDYMHLVCLGVTLKLIELWLNGSTKVKLSDSQRKTISDKLVNLRNDMPSDFSRKPRQFQNVRRLWKAHELRQFLLYSGPVVLHNVLSEDCYSNFLLLHVAISILVNPILCKDNSYLNYAEALLIHFIRTYEILYGANNVTYNTHNLLHLVGDVRVYGCLDSFSAFPFENHIRKIKQLVRKGDKPLQQVHRRLGEIVACKDFLVKKENETSALQKTYYNGPILSPHYNDNKFQIFREKSLYLNVMDCKNNCVLLKDGSIVECLNLVENKEKKRYIIGKRFEKISNFYCKPLDSSILNISLVKRGNGHVQSFPWSILAKMCKMSYNGNYIVFPLIHTYRNE